MPVTVFHLALALYHCRCAGAGGPLLAASQPAFTLQMDAAGLLA